MTRDIYDRCPKVHIIEGEQNEPHTRELVEKKSVPCYLSEKCLCPHNVDHSSSILVKDHDYSLLKVHCAFCGHFPLM